ncbi:MAG: hypothetical protein ABIU09_11205 [Pyrinomonadaceae bacterium]
MELVYAPDKGGKEMTGVSTITNGATANVAREYVHFDKIIDPGENIDLGFTHLKWHNLAPADEPVPGEIYDLARKFLTNEAAAGNPAGLGDLGFVILHRCGKGFYFLLVGTWKNENELWEIVYAKTNDDQADFGLFPIGHPHHATFCVWELAAVWHEQQAWKRFLLSSRDKNATIKYLQDSYQGPA